MKLIIKVLLVCFFTISLVLAKTPGEVEVNGVLHEATMQGLTGPAKKLGEYRGKPLVINVWASWCGPCRQEMPSLEKLSRRGNGKFAVIGISTDDYPEAAKAFLQREKTSFSHFIDSKLLLENMLGADRLPLTLLIDANGKVLGKYYGARDWNHPKVIKEISEIFRIQM